jgi:hypothetical protein
VISRGAADVADILLSVMHDEFGRHLDHSEP